MYNTVNNDQLGNGSFIWVSYLNWQKHLDYSRRDSEVRYDIAEH